jgi:hypothetical protein
MLKAAFADSDVSITPGLGMVELILTGTGTVQGFGAASDVVGVVEDFAASPCGPGGASDSAQTRIVMHGDVLELHEAAMLCVTASGPQVTGTYRVEGQASTSHRRPAAADGVTPAQLTAAGWTCIPPHLAPTLLLCAPPGTSLPPLPGTPAFADRLPSDEFLVFELATGAFLGTELLLRPDIYQQGTPRARNSPAASSSTTRAIICGSATGSALTLPPDRSPAFVRALCLFSCRLLAPSWLICAYG